MYSVITKTAKAVMAVLIMGIFLAPAVVAEEVQVAAETQQAEAVASAEETRPEAEASEPTAEQQVEAVPTEAGSGAEKEPEAAPESEQPAVEPASDAAEQPELMDIPENQVPLSGGREPSVTIRAQSETLRIGDTLVLTAELNGFDGVDHSIRWQALEGGQWKDLSGEGGTRLTVLVTSDNADCAYRVLVDA